MGEDVCLNAHRTQNYVYDRLLYFAKAHNIDESEVDYWYTMFESFLHEAQVKRIDFGDDTIPINIEESISSMEDILSRRYG